ncbi:MAG: chorismate synthase [Chloroflexi bacterium]|nr:chorismate synthase [Chloroflexota bacterium]
MSSLRFLTAGESHGPALAAIVEGMPAGVALDEGIITRDLRRRQEGYGRGGRMKIERDEAEILGGVLAGRTSGAPIALRVENKDWANWKGKEVPPQTIPRPGHADLAGKLKHGHEEFRVVAERASARATAMLVAAGAVARALMTELGISVYSQVIAIGTVKANPVAMPLPQLMERLEASSLRCPDSEAEAAMRQAIDEARDAGDSLGGVFEVTAIGVPPGLGSYTHWDRRLDGRLAQAMMSIPAIKGVEIGDGFAIAAKMGTQAHDELFYRDGRICRVSNRAGGIEGGVSNGEPIIVRAAMKPIPTTVAPQRSVDIATRQETQTKYQRSDVCAVPAAAVVGEAMMAWVLADALLEKFGGDNLADVKVALERYLTT